MSFCIALQETAFEPAIICKHDTKASYCIYWYCYKAVWLIYYTYSYRVQRKDVISEFTVFKVILSALGFSGFSPTEPEFNSHWHNMSRWWHQEVHLRSLLCPVKSHFTHSHATSIPSLCKRDSLRFNDHFPGEPGLTGVHWSKGKWKWWRQLEL